MPRLYEPYPAHRIRRAAGPNPAILCAEMRPGGASAGRRLVQEVFPVMLVRTALAAVLLVALATTPLFGRDGAELGSGLAAYAAPADSPSLQNGNTNANGNSNANDNANNNDNDDEGDNDNGNEVDGGDDSDNGDDSGGDQGAAPAPMQVVSPSTAACSSPGQESTVTSDDGRVVVRVFGTMPRPIRLAVRLPLDAGVTPPPPGPVVGGLLFQLIAEDCGGGPIPVLPAEVNLGARYSDADAAGLNEQNFTIARLDTNTNQWQTVEKQAGDPPNNFSSATITEMGYYVVYQRS